MSDASRVPAPVEALIRAVAGGSGHDGDERAMTFARGLALGALVGAAIAGSTLWQRRHARQTRTLASGPTMAAPPASAGVSATQDPAATTN